VSRTHAITALSHLAVVVLLGCGRTIGRADPQACAPVSGRSSQERAEVLTGTFQLRMVATEGKAEGAAATGTLTLMARAPADRMTGDARDTLFAYPVYGGASLDFASIGVVTPGDAASMNPASPGVLVIERLADSLTAPGRVLLRLGAEANSSQPGRIEGAYAVLRVARLSKDEFAGSWDSGAPLSHSKGYFCAVRSATPAR
jgi:hypothetical protein